MRLSQLGRDFRVTKFNSSWRELIRVWAQWLGITLAAIVAGIVLGILLKNGVGTNAARAIALALGFVLSVLFWWKIAHLFVARPVPCANAISTTTVFQFQTQGVSPVPAFAAVVLCVSLYSVPQPASVQGGAALTAQSNVISRI
jgi:hypothetical protein